MFTYIFWLLGNKESYKQVFFTSHEKKNTYKNREKCLLLQDIKKRRSILNDRTPVVHLMIVKINVWVQICILSWLNIGHHVHQIYVYEIRRSKHDRSLLVIFFSCCFRHLSDFLSPAPSLVSPCNIWGDTYPEVHPRSYPDVTLSPVYVSIFTPQIFLHQRRAYANDYTPHSITVTLCILSRDRHRIVTM